MTTLPERLLEENASDRQQVADLILTDPNSGERMFVVSTLRNKPDGVMEFDAQAAHDSPLWRVEVRVSESGGQDANPAAYGHSALAPANADVARQAGTLAALALQPSVGGEAVLGYVRREAIKRLREDDEVTGVMVHVEAPKDSVPVYLASPTQADGCEVCIVCDWKDADPFPRFIESEVDGRSVRFEWRDRADGLKELVIPTQGAAK